MDSTYLEALGIREGTIPPEYRELLAVSFLLLLFFSWKIISY